MKQDPRESDFGVASFYRWNPFAKCWEYWHGMRAQWCYSFGFAEKDESHPMMNLTVISYIDTWAEDSESHHE